MIIRYCPTCAGKPYTSNITMTHCPVDNSVLLIESVQPETLKDRKMLESDTASHTGQPAAAPLPDSSFDPISSGNSPSNITTAPSSLDNEMYTAKKNKNTPAKPNPGAAALSAVRNALSGIGNAFSHIRLPSLRFGCVTVTGTVKAYSMSTSETNGYRRLPWTRLWQAIRYHQRTEDVLHRFIVVNDSMDSTCCSETLVNAHGIIGSGATLSEHEIVEVTGRYSPATNVLYAHRITVKSHGGSYPVTFQRSVKGTILAIVLALLSLLLIIGLFTGNSCQDGGGASSTVLFTALALAVVALACSSPSKRKGSRNGCAMNRYCLGVGIVVLIAIALIIWVIHFITSGQMSGFVSGLLTAIEPLIVPLVVIIILVSIFRSFFKRD